MKKSLGPKTLLYPTPVLVVGTYDANGKANAMVASWGGICCSQPPCINISLRKATYKLLGDRRTQGVSPRAYRMGIHGDRAAL